MGIEPMTRSLGSCCSTTELHPRSVNNLARRAAVAEGTGGLDPYSCLKCLESFKPCAW